MTTAHLGPRAVWLAATLALAGACGGGRNPLPGDEDGGGAVASGPSRVVPLAPDARVDLPGKVSVFVQVLQGDGSPAADLPPSAFRIYENGQPVSQSESQQQLRPRPQVFRAFTHLIVDRSNSVQQSPAAIQAQKDGAKRYVDVVTAQSPESYVKVSWFDGQSELHAIAGHDTGFTNDPASLHAAIDALDAEPPFSPSTNLYGAVIDALDDLDEVDAVAITDGIPHRSLALVTFTDGTHQAGPVATLQEAQARVNETAGGARRYSAFTIGLGSEIDTAVLQALGPNGAEFADEIEDLVPRFEAVGAGVRALANSFYLLSYCSPKTAGMHQLRISVRTEPGEGDAVFPFDATHFGAGCGFLDVYTQATLAGALDHVTITDALEDAQGRVVVCGWRSNACTTPGCGQGAARGFVARLLADPLAPDPTQRLDGRLDASFGSGGLLLLDEAGLTITGATAIVRDPADGALLVGGWSRASAGTGLGQASVWRIPQNGASALRADLPNPAGVDQVVRGVVLDPLGRLVAVGARGSATRSSAVWAVDAATLAPDPSFGSGGVYVHPDVPLHDVDVATEVAVDALGRLLVVGEGYSANAPSWNQNRELKLIALDPATGTPDTTFSGDGIAHGSEVFPTVSLPSRPAAVAMDSQGRIVVGGTLLESTGGGVRQQPVLCRLLGDGSADPAFAGSVSSRFPATGVVTLRLGSTDDPSIDFGRDAAIEDLFVDAAGGVLAAGWRSNAEGHRDLALFGFAPNGVPASDYNVVGFLIEDGSTADDSSEAGRALLVHSTGAIWTLGTSRPAADVADVPVAWIDRDPRRAYPPLGN